MTKQTKTVLGTKKKSPAKRQAATKAETILRLLKRPTGATLTELTKATQWQPHSVRGFLSGTVRKRRGLPLQSNKDDKGVRRYSIQSDGETA